MDTHAVRDSAGSRRDSKADTLLLAVMGVGLLTAVGIGHAWNHPAQAYWVGIPMFAAAAAVWAVARGTFFARASMGVLSMAMVSLHIHLGMGQSLYHFGVFVVLAVLLIYRDWRVPVIAAGVIAVQHALFNELQQAGFGVICFAKPGWGEVLAHAAYVVAQTAVEVWIALQLARHERGALEVRRLVVARDGTLNLDVRGASITTPGARSVANALGLMQEAVRQVKSSAAGIRVASRDVAEGSADLSEHSADHAARLAQSSSDIARFAEGLKQNTLDARQANDLATGASEIAARGGAVVRDVVATMNGISEDSRKISDIIGIIDGIAFQTNILALNAAVEAARAGEQGRGFAVVAAEVRSLAQRSAAAARETKQLIENSGARVDAGTRLVDNAGRTMDEMVAAARQVAALIANIAKVSAQQTAHVEAVENSIDSIEEVTRRNASRVRHSADAAQEMARLAEDLFAAVSRFQVEAGGSAAEGGDAFGQPRQQGHGQVVSHAAHELEGRGAAALVDGARRGLAARRLDERILIPVQD